MSNPILLSKEHDITAFASPDPTRYVLQSVHYDANGQFVEACNGNQLIRVPVSTSEDYPPITGANGTATPDCLLPIKPLKKAFQAIPKSIVEVLCHVALTAVAGEGNKIRLTTNDLDTENSAVVKTIEGNFPNTSQIIPTEPVKFSIALSPHELGIICDYCAKHSADNASIVFQFTDELSPVRWKTKTAQGRDVTGVLMPMRLS